MKLIIAVVQDHVVNDVLMELANNEIRATKLSSTGGFLKRKYNNFSWCRRW